jgi:hypothetical protein
MKALSCIVAAAALAGSLGGCAYDYYSYPRYGYSQGYYYPSSYTYYPSSYTYYSTGPSYAYAYPRYYRSDWDYYRHYNGIHAGPELSQAGTVP